MDGIGAEWRPARPYKPQRRRMVTLLRLAVKELRAAEHGAERRRSLADDIAVTLKRETARRKPR